MYGVLPRSFRLCYGSLPVYFRQEPKSMSWNHRVGWLDPQASAYWFGLCQSQIVWEQPQVRVYGKYHRVPRLSAFLADASVSYRYSGVIHQGKGWPDWFAPLLEQVNASCSAQFNGCLFNLYRDGDDRMGWHADDEPEIDARCPIASLSFGATRALQFRHRQSQSREELALADGDLLVMEPDCQRFWMHALPVRKRVRTARLNLTFRVFLPMSSAAQPKLAP